MPPSLSQANQPIEVMTPLGKDVLLITGFRGEESLSHLFTFHVDMVADTKKDIAFDKILGQKVSIRLNQQAGKVRHFSGICNRFGQGQGDTDFTTYQMEIVPQFWLLTKRVQTRIFQQKSVPDILKKVLEGLDVTFQIDGTFQPRNYCVQYRESDFNFASRLMEDEGIYYFFTHTADGHKMVVANMPGSHPDMPLNSKLQFERNVSNNILEDRVLTWEKHQELVSGQHTLRDHKFEMRGKNLEVKKTIAESVQVGKVAHKIKVGNDKLEVYDYPGDYANRFDGITPGGGEQAGELSKITQDNERVIGIRSQQEAVLSMKITATSTCRNLVSGHKFTLQKHGSGDGDYVITSIVHETSPPIDYKSNATTQFRYLNTMNVIPLALPFRPQRETPRPFVHGTQTATVVGTSGQEIDCDKYGRVKVQFNWDRDGVFDPKSSCWVRVATHWAGEKWGIIHIPRIGHEVVVGFEEGDPDLPIIIGSVYNNSHMPPYDLPKNKTQSGIKSRSSLKGTADNYNEIRFEDLKGKEQILVHAERNMDTSVEVDQSTTIGHNHVVTIGTDPKGDPTKDGTSTTKIFGDTSLTVEKGNYTVTIQAGSAYLNVDTKNREVDVKEQYILKAKNISAEAREEYVTMKAKTDFFINGGTIVQLRIAESQNFINVESDGTIGIHGDTHIEAAVGGNLISIKNDGKIVVYAETELKLQGPGGAIVIDASGITIEGKQITSTADGVNTVKGAKVDLNP